MYNFTTKEEVDFDYFMELLWNNEFQVVNREWTEEEKAELSREIVKRRTMRTETLATEKEKIVKEVKDSIIKGTLEFEQLLKN